MPVAEAARPRLQPRPAIGRHAVEAVTHLVEVGVARTGERGRQRHRLVHERIPVLERLAVLHVGRGAGERFVGLEGKDEHVVERELRGAPRDPVGAHALGDDDDANRGIVT